MKRLKDFTRLYVIYRQCRGRSSPARPSETTTN